MSIENMKAEPKFKILARAKLPIVTGKVVDAVVFGDDASDPDVIALVHKNGDTTTDKALVRLHSACITSEVLGSSKCDCAEQLDTAISLVSDSDWGIVVYLLKHEGRGIGLVNKIRAYSLQDEGFDTVDANLELGFGADDRNFDPAVRALRLLGVKRIELLTNNPDKVEALSSSGFDVVKRIAMDVPITEFNRGYLIKKQQYFGHQPLRCPSTGFLTVEAATEFFNLEISKSKRVASAIAVHIDCIGSIQCPSAQERVAVRAAEIIKGHTLFDGALIARTASDRFLILLCDTDLGLAERMAEHLHGAMKDVPFANKSSSESQSPVLTSIGVADLSSGDDSSLLTLAAFSAVDRALSDGGNQVVVVFEDCACSA